MKVSHLLKSNKVLLSLWCAVAAFGTYFCMYAFRKPFSTGLYENLFLWGFSYKTVLIITQVLGYMISKFVGIKIISELRQNKRIALIISLIVFAEIALILFAIVPFPYNFIFLFFNGLPLGMVWGIIFSFLEGRRITEFIVLGLCSNLVVGSGVLKTIYLSLYNSISVSEFLMPAIIGLIFLPLFLFFVLMLAQIPKPDLEDIALKSERPPMTTRQKKNLLAEYGVGLCVIFFLYMILTTIRDFRDNFSVEIWKSMGQNFDKNIFATTELTVGLFVLILLATVGLFKDNKSAFWYIQLLIFLGIVSCGGSTWLFEHHHLSAQTWMIVIGISFFLPYLLLQTLFFERFIALFRLKANAGFFVYICDSMGYLGSMSLMIYKEFFIKNLRWIEILTNLSYGVFGLGLLCWSIFMVYIVWKQKENSFALN